MTCVELQKSLADTADSRDQKQQAHLKSCAACAALVTELELIASSATTLREADEPSPRVWNSIEIELRREGLIHPPRPNRSLIPSLTSRWLWARWLVPAAAVLVLAAGLYVRRHSGSEPMARNAAPAVSDVSDASAAGLNDADLLQELSTLPAETQAQYTDNLRRVNEYIRDARTNVVADPNDEEARRSLLEAYQQKAMLFELAMDRSLQ